ncbi:hypothetical protein OC834_001455 [Tilletia horrida]|nr:hypothetical protein OC834_001455 [Tilletia horrida]
MSSSTIANPLFDPLQFDPATPTPSRLHSARAGELTRDDSGFSSSLHVGSSASSSAEGSPSPAPGQGQGSSAFLSRTIRGRLPDESGSSRSAQELKSADDGSSGANDLFGDKRVSRVFGSYTRTSLFGDDDEAADEETPSRNGRMARGRDADHSARSSRFYGRLGDGADMTATVGNLRSVSATTASSRSHTPLPDRGDDGDGAEPSLNLLATLHRMQDSDIERYMRMFAGPGRSAGASGREPSSEPTRSSPGSYSGHGNNADEAPSLRSISNLELPEVSTPSEDMSLHAPPSTADYQLSSRSATASIHSTDGRQSGTDDALQPAFSIRDTASLAFVRTLSSALSTALQSAADANAEVEALLGEHEREIDNKRREWEAREAALRALCAQHGIKNGEIDRALMRASPLQQELEGRKTAGVSPAPSGPSGNAQTFLSPPVLGPSSATGTGSQERFTDPEPDAITSGGLSALHESLQEAMLDDLERSPTAAAPTQMANIQPVLDHSASERSISPALSTSRHRRSSSKSTMATTRTRDTSPGAASARSSRSQRPLSVSSVPTSEGTSASKTSVPAAATKPASAAVTAANTFTRAFWRTKKSPAGSAASSVNVKPQETKLAQPNVTRLPSIFNFSSSGANSAQQSPKVENKALKTDLDKSASTERPGPKTVELDFMLPSDAKPPTFASLTRRDSSDNVRASAPQQKKRSARRAREGSAEGSEESSGDEFEVYGGKGSLVPPRPVFSEIDSDVLTPQLLTDRYGFVYDATPADIKLLREARKASSSAPACLTGIRVGMRARGMDDSDDEGTETDHDPDAEMEDEDDEEGGQATSAEEDATESDVEEAGANKGDVTVMAGGASTFSIKTAVAPAMLTLDLPPSMDFTGLDTFVSGEHVPASKPAMAPGLTPVSEARPVIEASVILAESKESGRLGPTSPSQELEFKMSGGSSAAQVTSAPEVESPSADRKSKRAPPSGSQTVRKLLSQLQSMHDKQQAEQQSEWDAFLKRRKEQQLAAAAAASQVASKSANRMSRVFGTPSPALATSPSNLAAGADEEELIHGLVGIQRLGETKAGKEDWAALQRLCRQGIPLCYRGAIWKECSGATEMAEPGRYDELLGEHEGETNECLTQIDLDVHRTMPTNIFFGGNGPGVPKLRRVLVAFSWYDPVCGYCQGMNNLAATLLLTLPNEEDAFWVLACIISKILPAEYYTSHLLVSQADQRVLVELVDEHLPKLAEHMREIGVDLPAVTFAWFLSLFTDCLPVETLFRVWDILFIDGMVVLFRIAMAILMLSEKDLIATSGPAAFYGHMHSLTSRMFSVDRLMKLACEDLVQTIKYPNILVRREKHVKDLRMELGLDSA